MHGVAVLLFAAAAAYALARFLDVPGIPLLVLAGLAVSVVDPPPAGVLEDALLLGVTVLLFVVGLELDPRRIRAQRTAALYVGAVQFVVLAALGYLTSALLGYTPLEAGYIALALTASSTLIGVRILQRRQQMFEPYGRLVLGVLLIQDLLVLLSIPLVTELARGWEAAAASLGGIALLGALSLAVRRWVGPLILRAGADQEAVLLATLAILFVFLGAAELLGTPLVVGAFLAGVSLSRFPVNGVVRSELAPVGDFFAAIFFTALGGLVGIPDFDLLWRAAALIVLLLVVTPPLVTVIAERAGFSAKPAIEAGLLLSQASEISLVIGLTGMLQGSIGVEVFTVIAVVTMVTMLLTPLLATDAVTWRLVHLHPGRSLPGGEPPADHVLLLGTGSTGMPILEDLIVAGYDVVVVDDDPAVIERLAEADVRTIRGDASEMEVLRRAGADRARVVSSTIRRARDNGALLEIARGRPVLVRVFDAADARWVEEQGGVPVLYSEATADALMEWFVDSEPELRERLAAR